MWTGAEPPPAQSLCQLLLGKCQKCTFGVVFFDNDNNKSLEIEWALDAGSDFTSGAVPSAWESQANADRSVNDLALQDNTANDWAITGIQLEVGEFSSTTLPPFQFEDFGDNLSRCFRYFYKMSGNDFTSSKSIPFSVFQYWDECSIILLVFS